MSARGHDRRHLPELPAAGQRGDPAGRRASTSCTRATATPTRKPKLGLKRATLAKKKLRLPISCPKAEVRCAGLVTLVGVGRRKGETVSLKLGTITFTLAGGKSKTLTRGVSRKQRRALRRLKGARLRVKLDVVDASGNRTKVVKRVALKR